MILALVIFASCEEYLNKLTSSSFVKMVENHPRNEVWMVMFSGASCPACQDAYPKYVNASELSAGLIKFGIVDTQKSPDIAEKYGIRAIPHFLIFHSNTHTEYVGKRASRDFLNSAVSFMPDFVQKAESSWESSYLEKPTAILFSNKEKAPPMWVGISAYFYGKSIRIGFCNDDQIIEKYSDKVPTIMFFNGTNTEKYDGNNDFNSIKAAISSFFMKKLLESSNDEGEILSPKYFVEKCLGGRKNCIINVGKGHNKKFEKIKNLNSRHKMLWFSGDIDIPYSFMKGGIWIYNPRRDGFIYVESDQLLEEAIDRVIDGGAAWKKRENLEKEL